MQGSNADNVTRKVLIVFGLPALALCCYIQYICGYFGDKQWELLYAQMWLSGRQLYVDIFPVSPPLIFWLYSLPARTADWLGFVRDYQMLVMMGLAVATFSITLSTRFIAGHLGFADASRRLQFAALLCFVLIFRTSTIYFLDREHLFLMLILPYLMLCLPSLAGAAIPQWQRVACGMLAGLGFCLKPHCLVVLAGTEAMVIISRRSWKTVLSLENLVIYGMGLGYLLLAWYATPGYFHSVMPMAIVTYSSTRDENPIWFYAANAVSVLLPLALLFRPKYDSPYRRDIYYLSGLLPFFFLYALVNNNWAYTYYPLSSMALILTGFMLWEFLYLARLQGTRQLPTFRLWLGGVAAAICFVFFQGWFEQYTYAIALVFALCAAWENLHLRKHDREKSLPHWTLWAGAFTCLMSFALKILLTLGFFPALITDKCTPDPRCLGDDRFVAELESPHGSVLSFGAISVEFGRWTRLADFTGAVWQTRFPQLWMLPKFLVSDEHFRQSHQWILDYVADAFAEDMNIQKPDVMFVDDTDIVYGKHIPPVDLVRYFSFNARFLEAWSHYRFERRINMCGPNPPYKSKCSYDVYRRIS